MKYLFKAKLFIFNSSPASISQNCQDPEISISRAENSKLLPLKCVAIESRQLWVRNKVEFIMCFDIVNENLYFVVNKPCDWLKQIT